jgi:hypothetical protein
MKRKHVEPTKEPYHLNPHIAVTYELPFGNDLIKPGDKIRIKNLRGTFTVHKFAQHTAKDVMWVDCQDTKTGEYKSFYVEKIKSIVRAKRSYRKKLHV